MLLTFTIFFTGCSETSFRSTILTEAKKKGWTKKQSKVAAAYAHAYFLNSLETSGEKNDDPLSDTDTKSLLKLPKIKYNLLDLDRVIIKIDQWLKDFDILLGYSMPEEVKYVDTFGLRPSLDHDEMVMRAIRARVKAVILDRKFRTMLGQVPIESAETNCAGGYNVSDLFGPKNLLDSFKFNFDQIDEARKVGVLKLIEYIKIQISRTFDHKERDPNDLKDDNAFIWIPINQEIEISNFKIINSDRPENNIGNYIEAYRYNNGKKESRPCLKVFMPKSEKPNSVLVIDTKKEGDAGFGLPDFVEERSAPVNVNDLVRDQALIDRLFDSQKEKKRIPPKNISVYVEIAKSENPIDVWEKTKDIVKGFVVPFKYSNPLGSNYNIRIQLNKTITYFKKEWTNGNRFEPTLGEVVECYKAKPPYDKLKFISAKVVASEDTKRVLFTKEDGSTEEGFINPGKNRFIEDKPTAIFYSEGEKRYVIKRSSDSLTFDKKKELSTNVIEKTGVYGDDNLRLDLLK